MNKKYYLVKLDSIFNYYKCTAIYKAENEEVLRSKLNETNASDMYIVSIKEIDFENNKEEYLKQVNSEIRMYEEYKEV